MFKLTWKALALTSVRGKWHVVVCLTYTIAWGLFPALLNLATVRFIDAVSTGHPALTWIFALCVAYAVNTAGTALYAISLNAGIFESLTHTLRERVMESVSSWPLKNFEDTQSLDSRQHAQVAIENEDVGMILYASFNALRGIVTLLSLTAVLAHYHWALSVLAFVTLVPTLVTQRLEMKVLRRLRQQQVPTVRESEYVLKLLTSPHSLKELRAYRAETFLRETWQRVSSSAAEGTFRVRRQVVLWKWATEVLTWICYALAIVLIWLLAHGGLIGAAAVAGAVLAFRSLQDGGLAFFGAIGQWHVHTHLAEAILDSRYDRHLPQDAFARATDAVVELQNVSFHYPGATTAALRDISLTLRRGSTIALVGANGSGKTTLSRLLSGAYAASSGQIKRSGQEPTAVMSQTAVRYPLTCLESVTLKDGHGVDDRARATELVQRFLGSKLPVDTQLGKDVDGAELSGGQWSRLAMSRVVFHAEADLVILDEPTGAIDPLEERALLTQLVEATRGRTGVIVTHRLALCPQVDAVVLLDQGRIAAIGSHAELLQSNALYRSMYTAQEAAFASGE